MRWVSWLLGIAGVVQFAVIAYLQPTDYVSVDMAYLVMWLAIIGGLLLCWIGCSYGCGGWEEGCDCCDDNCNCGDCDGCCEPGHADESHAGHKH